VISRLWNKQAISGFSPFKKVRAQNRKAFFSSLSFRHDLNGCISSFLLFTFSLFSLAFPFLSGSFYHPTNELHGFCQKKSKSALLGEVVGFTVDAIIAGWQRRNENQTLFHRKNIVGVFRFSGAHPSFEMGTSIMFITRMESDICLLSCFEEENMGLSFLKSCGWEY